jgi:hypothetical protein
METLVQEQVKIHEQLQQEREERNTQAEAARQAQWKAVHDAFFKTDAELISIL